MNQGQSSQEDSVLKQDCFPPPGLDPVEQAQAFVQRFKEDMKQLKPEEIPAWVAVHLALLGGTPNAREALDPEVAALIQDQIKALTNQDEDEEDSATGSTSADSSGGQIQSPLINAVGASVSTQPSAGGPTVTLPPR